MSSKPFSALLDEKIESFLFAFKRASSRAFFNENGKLIHAGEYGTYREAIARDFLRSFVPSRLSIGSGFVIDSRDSISTQSDIVIFDAQNTPILETNERQRFYPIETVCGVGEIKSVVDRTMLKKALEKLAKVKKMRAAIRNPVVTKRNDSMASKSFSPGNHFDQVPTFLICQRFDFDLKQIPKETGTWYKKSTPLYCHHNMILSLKDGLLLYHDYASRTMMYPEMDGGHGYPRFIVPDDGELIHFHIFCSYLFMMTSNCTVLYPDITKYMPPIEGKGKRIDYIRGQNQAHLLDE